MLCSSDRNINIFFFTHTATTEIYTLSLHDALPLCETRALRESHDAEVRLVHAEQQRGLRGGPCVVVGSARPVRRSDLDEPCSGAREHVGDAKAVTDLDQLAARHEHVAPFRQ